VSTGTPTLDVGLHHNIPAAVYHADPAPAPSLSSGCLRTLLAKSPAHAALEHPRLGAESREATESMETGSLVHAILSGHQDEISVGNFDDFKSKAAQAWRADTREAGRVPVLPRAYESALKVADHVRARAAKDIDRGPFCPDARHEVTAIWKEGNVYCRARYDVLVSDQFTADIWDWKSTRDISDRGIEKAIANFRYDIQESFYLRGLEVLAPKLVRSFTLVFFETVPPYTVRRAGLSSTYKSEARKKVCEGIRIWQECAASGAYPVPSAETLLVEIPAFLDESETEITV
jgi:hypothetical protein